MHTYRLIIAMGIGLLVAAVGCDAYVGPEDASEGPAVRARTGFPSGGSPRGGELVPVCRPAAAGGYRLVHVAPAQVRALQAQGALLPGGPELDATCRPYATAATCSCFTAAELAAPVLGQTPEPYLFFDTYDYWGEDHRRTEVRAMLTLGGRLLEEVAALYVTYGSEAEPRPVQCWRQDVVPDPEHEVGWRMTSETTALTLAEAEACRRELYAFAAALPCQGPACGAPYQEALGSPPVAHRDLLPLHVELDRQRATVDPRVSRFYRPHR